MTSENILGKHPGLLSRKTVSVIVPVLNERKNISIIFDSLKKVFNELDYRLELIFIDDGSSDKSIVEIKRLARLDQRVKFLEFSRNFGKEVATTAGINFCSGEACILIDADLQHPVELIPVFIEKWEEGFEVVVGVRKKNKNAKLFKRVGAYLFYKMNTLIVDDVKIPPNGTDFRLLDRIVINEFNRLTEKNRLTRGLIDWLGFRRAFIHFEVKSRVHGETNYNFLKLFKLALTNFISMSLIPLKFAGFLGFFITLVSGFLGFYILIGKYFLHLTFASTFSDAENLAILIVFLVGIILMSLGIIALYTANIHLEIRNRPLYVLRSKKV